MSRQHVTVSAQSTSSSSTFPPEPHASTKFQTCSGIEAGLLAAALAAADDALAFRLLLPPPTESGDRDGLLLLFTGDAPPPSPLRIASCFSEIRLSSVRVLVPTPTKPLAPLPVLNSLLVEAPLRRAATPGLRLPAAASAATPPRGVGVLRPIERMARCTDAAAATMEGLAVRALEGDVEALAAAAAAAAAAVAASCLLRWSHVMATAAAVRLPAVCTTGLIRPPCGEPRRVGVEARLWTDLNSLGDVLFCDNRHRRGGEGGGHSKVS